MNIDTGEIFEDREAALHNAREKGFSKAEANSKMLPLINEEYTKIQGMNRAQRRAWAKANKKRIAKNPIHKQEYMEPESSSISKS